MRNGTAIYHQLKNPKYPTILPMTKAIIAALTNPHVYRAKACSYFILSNIEFGCKLSGGSLLTMRCFYFIFNYFNNYFLVGPNPEIISGSILLRFPKYLSNQNVRLLILKFSYNFRVSSRSMGNVEPQLAKSFTSISALNKIEARNIQLLLSLLAKYLSTMIKGISIKRIHLLKT